MDLTIEYQNSYIYSSLGKFSLTLEDVVALIGLPVFEEATTIKLPKSHEEVAVDEAGKRKLEALNKALSDSKSSNKSTYASWVRHFIINAGSGSNVGFETMLSTGSHGTSCRASLEGGLKHIYFLGK